MKKNTILFLILALSTILHAANTMKIGQYEVLPKTDFIIQLEVENSDAFVAFQVDIPIPSGFNYVDGSAVLNASRISGHALTASLLTGNILRLIGYSFGNTPFSGNSGALVSLTLKSGSVPATFELALNNSLLGNSQSTNILTGSSNGSVTVLAPNITLSTSVIEYGSVPLESFVEQTFEITNTGSTDLTINGLSFNDSQFTITTPTNFTVNPNTSRSITVKFSPVLKGTLIKQLQISSNDPDQATMNIVLNARAYAVNEIHTGTITGASSSTKTLEFTLNNMESFTGFQFDLNLPQPIVYKTGTAQLFRAQDQTVSINQINSQTLRVVCFSASGKNFTGNNGKVLNLDFSLYGNAGYYSIGISNVIIANNIGENILSDSYGGQLVVTCPYISASSQLNFGDVSILSDSTIQYRIYNSGQEPLTINQLQFSNTYFKSNQTLPITIQPDNYYDLPIDFAKDIKGTTNGTLKILSNDPTNNNFGVLLSGNAFVPNYLLINNQTFVRGESKIVSIDVLNEEPFVALQFDLSFPPGFTPDLNTLTLTNRKQDHILATNALSNSTIRILIFSPGQKSFTGKSGSILTIPFKVDLSMVPGTYDVSFSNVLISNASSENINYSAFNTNGKINVITKFGDTDGNNNVNAYDAALVLQYSVGLNPLPSIDPIPWENWRLNACDVDGSGKITAYDAALILRKSVGLISNFVVENSTSNIRSLVRNTDIGVSIKKVDNYLVLTSQGALIGFNVWLNNNFEALGKPENVLSSMFISSNLSPTSYQIGIMTMMAPNEGSVLMKIPIQIPLNDLTIHLNVNGNDKVIVIDLSTGLIDSYSYPESEKINIYPNPAQDYLTIDLDALELSNYSIRITNSLGQTVYFEVIKELKKYINLTEFSYKGIYYIQLIDNQNRIISTKKIIKK